MSVGHQLETAKPLAPLKASQVPSTASDLGLAEADPAPRLELPVGETRRPRTQESDEGLRRGDACRPPGRHFEAALLQVKSR